MKFILSSIIIKKNYFILLIKVYINFVTLNKLFMLDLIILENFIIINYLEEFIINYLLNFK
jgi:hypothetical protein